MLLNWQTYAGEDIPSSNSEWRRRYPFERRTENDYVGWQFDSSTFEAELERADLNQHGSSQGDWEAKTRVIENQFPIRGTSWSDLNSIVDNGMGVRIRGTGQTANPFSSFEIETEGHDIAQGPNQISISNRDAHEVYWLSPAPMTDRLAAQVRCAERSWPTALKFFVCPFA